MTIRFTQLIVFGLTILAALMNPTYASSAPAESEVIQHTTEFFDTLSTAEKAMFLENRKNFLFLAEKALTSHQKSIGKIATYRMNQKFEKFENENHRLTTEALTYHDGTREDILVNLEQRREELKAQYDTQRLKSSEQVSKEAISQLLRILDANMWMQAPVIANSNEFGIIATIGLVLEGGQPVKGYGGLFDLGVSIGYNKEEKALALQFFTDVEKYKTTLLKGFFVAGAVVKLGPYAANQKTELRSVGTSFYPPAVPGFATKTPNSFATGFSSGLTIPPFPWGDLITYENTMNRKVHLRVSLPRLTKGFVRVFGVVKNPTVRFLLTPIKQLLAGRPSQCRSLFN